VKLFLTSEKALTGRFERNRKSVKELEKQKLEKKERRK
jgi:hypothetical protein